MFVLSEKGDTFVFKIIEHLPKMEDLDHFNKNAAEVKGELLIENPVHIKDLKDVKMICCGSDHFLALTNSGEVYAMGDDTFG
jgi:alpha-tubulin suppressor-like RCC1 family protein